MPGQDVAFVVDRSGSMVGKEEDTVGGINTALNEIKRTKTDDDTIRVSIKLFDNDEIMLARRQDIESCDSFKREDFRPRGSTALYDAIGHTLKYFMELKLLDPSAYDTCIVYCATDGLENTSRYFTARSLKELIEAAEKTYKITVMYIGSNQDAILEAGRIGISQDCAMNYSETTENVGAAYRSMACAAARTRTQGSRGFLESERQESTQH